MPYHDSMYLSTRERDVIAFLADFRQATKQHVHDEVFRDLRSMTPCERALKRLMERGLIVRTLPRVVGGPKGGSGSYVYMTATDTKTRASLHTLAVVDVYAILRDSGGLLRRETEPTCWRVIGGVELRPDLYVELGDDRKPLRMFIEVDLGTEKARQLTVKLESFVRAAMYCDDEDLRANYPITTWVVPDQKRATELQRVIRGLSLDDGIERMFSVKTFDEFKRSFANTVDK